MKCKKTKNKTNERKKWQNYFKFGSPNTENFSNGI